MDWIIISHVVAHTAPSVCFQVEEERMVAPFSLIGSNRYSKHVSDLLKSLFSFLCKHLQRPLFLQVTSSQGGGGIRRWWGSG